MLVNLVGLNVIDHSQYQLYREKMYPILKRFGGDFGYDFQVSRVLRSRTDSPINRVFTILFPDQKSSTAFFSDGEYLKIKQDYFEPAVTDVTILAKFEEN